MGGKIFLSPTDAPIIALHIRDELVRRGCGDILSQHTSLANLKPFIEECTKIPQNREVKSQPVFIAERLLLNGRFKERTTQTPLTWTV